MNINLVAYRHHSLNVTEYEATNPQFAVRGRFTHLNLHSRFYILQLLSSIFLLPTLCANPATTSRPRSKPTHGEPPGEAWPAERQDGRRGETGLGGGGRLLRILTKILFFKL